MVKKSIIHFSTLCILVIIFNPLKTFSQEYSRYVIQHSQDKDLITRTFPDRIEIDFWEIDNYFTKLWLYHEVVSASGINCQVNIPGTINVSSDLLSVDEIYHLVEKAWDKSKTLSNTYDKETQGALISSCYELYGSEQLENILNRNIRTDTENDSCYQSSPFCTGTIYSFPAGVGSGIGETGPNYGCLTTRPNPVWYHMKIQQPGDITIRMVGIRTNGNNLDIDFALWGPYADPVTPCNGQLTADCSSCPSNTTSPNFYPSGNLHDCSYSSSNIEHAHIDGGQAGQYYILLITNYANAEGNITFEKTAGEGTTDCSILPPPASSNSPVCLGETILLTAADAPGAIYNWTGPNGFSSNLQNPIIPNAQYSHAGVYTLTITVGGNTSTPTTTEVFVYEPPTGVLTGGGSGCSGSNVPLTITATGIGPFDAVVYSSSGNPIILNQINSPHTFTVNPTTTSTYTLASISNIACSGNVSGSVTATIFPSAVVSFSTQNACSGMETQFTDLSTITQGSIVSWDWDFGDGSAHSTQQNPFHIYALSGTYQVCLTVVSNNGCSSSTVQSIIVGNSPVVSAGADISIPYGTNTQLDGTASGSGTLTYQWQPANLLVNPTVIDPTTVNLTTTTQFTLIVTDQAGCNNSDQVIVSITGGQLSCIITANPPEICSGGTSQLNASPSGGAGPGNYTFTWTSNPPGFNSNVQNPSVSPAVTTTYFLHLNDGYSDFNGQVTVTVNPKPIVSAGSNITIPSGTATQLNGSASGGTGALTYLWSPGNKVTNPTILNPMTVILTQTTVFTLQATDIKGCSKSDDMSVIVSGLPLGCTIVASPSVICRGSSTQLNATPVGGSGNYTYSWTSTPSGFTSNIEDPLVQPEVTTTYHLLLYDGFSSNTYNIIVTVNPMPVVAMNTANPCETQTTQFYDQSTVASGSITSWDWDFGDGTPHANIKNPTHVYQTSGTYQVNLTVGTNGQCYEDKTFSLLIKPVPDVNAGNDQTIGHGTTTQLNGIVSGGSGTHTYLWTPSNLLDNPIILNPITVALQSSTDFLLTAIDLNQCQNFDDLTVNVTGGPLSCTIIAMPGAVCSGANSLLNSTPSGGAGPESYIYTWTSDPPGFTSSIQDPTVNPITTTTYFLEVWDGYNSFESQVTVTVHPSPVPDAGADKTIPHGTTTILYAAVNGGLPPYQYAWSPPDMVVLPNSQSTQTNYIFTSTSFQVEATDSRGCTGNDEITISIAGGPLGINPTVLKPVICRNETTQLKALPYGGSGEYTYQWYSIPTGFSSTEAEPFITPHVNTTYYLVVDDGFHPVEDSVQVKVNQLPPVNLIPQNDPRIVVLNDQNPFEIGACVFDEVIIDAGNPGFNYLWSDGSISQTNAIGTSGIIYDEQFHTVKVTNPQNGCYAESSIKIFFTFQNCSYGIEESNREDQLTVYPNPSADGFFSVNMTGYSGKVALDIFNPMGSNILSRSFIMGQGNTHKEEVALKHFGKGIYILRIISSDGYQVVKKIVFN